MNAKDRCRRQTPDPVPETSGRRNWNRLRGEVGCAVPRAFGSALAAGMPRIAGAANIAIAATRENARVENIREVAIVSAD